MSTVITSGSRLGQTKTPLPLSFVQRHTVVTYWIITLALSWLIGFPLIATVQGWWDIHIPLALHYLASFGPMLAALSLTWATQGTAGLKELWSRITRWRVGAVGFGFTLFSPVALFVLASVVVRVTSGTWPDLALLGQMELKCVTKLSSGRSIRYSSSAGG
jgi:hypothetical protein